jgi:hypothetical protein
MLKEGGIKEEQLQMEEGGRRKSKKTSEKWRGQRFSVEDLEDFPSFGGSSLSLVTVGVLSLHLAPFLLSYILNQDPAPSANTPAQASQTQHIFVCPPPYFRTSRVR